MKLPRVQQSRLRQTLQWILRPCEFMTDARRELGDVFAVDVMGLGRLVLLSHPDDVARVFAGDPDTLRTGESNALVEPLLGAESLLVLDSPRHLEARRLVAPSFSRRAVDSSLEDIWSIAAGVAEERIPTGAPFRLHPVIRKITLRVMLRIVFGDLHRSRADQFYEAFKPLTGELAGVFAYLTPLQWSGAPFTPGRWFRRRVAELDGLIGAELSHRRRGRDRGGVISHLLDAQADGGARLTDAQIRDHVVTLLAAGHETVGSAIAWAFQWILSTPKARERLLSELTDPLSPSGCSDAYLEAACLESLRISPVAEAVSRVSTKSMEFGGFEVPQGSLVSPAIHLVHHRPDIYPEPESFRPERFLEGTFRSCEFFPFGGGQRLCLGRSLAIEEMKQIIGALLSRFEFELESSDPVRGKRRNVTIAPATGVPVRAQRRGHRAAW